MSAGFLSRYLSGHLPDVPRHIIVLSASLNKTFPSFLPFFLSSLVLLVLRLRAYSVVEYSLMVASIPFDFSFQSVLHDWCNKGRGMCYSAYWMMHIKYRLLLIGKSSPCGGSGFSPSLSGPLPYVQRHITVNKMC